MTLPDGHPTEEAMVEGYYEGLDAELQRHLKGCGECAALYGRICETLETASGETVPERGVGYGAEVWARVSGRLPAKGVGGFWRHWLLVPVVAAVVGVVLVAGLWNERKRETPPLVVLKPAQVRMPVAAVALPAHLPSAKVARRKPAMRAAIHKPSDVEQDGKLLALNSLLEVDEKAALPPVLRMIQGDSSDRTKEHALFVLAQSDSAEAHQALLDFAKQSANVSLQTKAVRMMAMTGSEGERKELAGVYRASSSQALKLEILNGLMASGSKTTLLTVAKSEANPGLRNSAMANLSFTLTPNQASDFVLKDAPGEDKQQILKSVFFEVNSDALVEMLKKQPSASMRVATIRSLAVMGEQGRVLTDIYLKDRDEEVRRAVLDALVLQRDTGALSELAESETDGFRKAEILSRVASIRAQAGVK